MIARYRSPDDCKPWNAGIEFTVQIGNDGRLDQEDFGSGLYFPQQFEEISGWVLVGLEESDA